jgi:hypothetical protein
VVMVGGAGGHTSPYGGGLWLWTLRRVPGISN